MYKFAFVGNPNAGKSTWINILTSSSFKVANYLGVSVQAEIKRITFKNQKIQFIDLPGIYDLEYTIGEEEYTKNYLLNNDIDLIVNVIDYRDLNRSLILTAQLKKLNIPMLILLNFIKPNENIEHIKKISEYIKLPILYLDKRKRKEAIQIMIETSNKKYLNKSNSFQKIEKLNINHIHKEYRLDSILLHPNFGIPILLSILISSIYILYYVTSPMGDRIYEWIQLASSYLLSTYQINPFIDKIVEAIFFSFASISSFLPFLGGIFFLLAFLEESGYIARIAYLLHHTMCKFNLSGKSVIPLLIGFGCNVPAIMATRTISNKKERIQCALMIPFISCSAKLPIFLLFTRVFFKNNQIGIILMLYSISIFTSLMISSFLSVKTNHTLLFIMELPSYAIPRISILWNKTKSELLHFLNKVSKIMILSIILLTFILPLYSKLNMQALFKPLGFSESEIAIESIPFGFISKENILIYYSQKAKDIPLDEYIASLWKEDELLKALCYLLYLSMSIPCIMTVSAIKSEFGNKVLVSSILLMLIVPYILCLFAYHGVHLLRFIL